MTLTLVYGKLSFVLPKEVDVSLEEIVTKCLAIVKKDCL